jgi:hypothetical protein
MATGIVSMVSVGVLLVRAFAADLSIRYAVYPAGEGARLEGILLRPRTKNRTPIIGIRLSVSI